MSQSSLSATQDDVAVYKDMSQVFKGARPIKATVKEESKLMEHPTEDGTVVTDHKVNLPVEIEFTLLIPGKNYRDVYEEIRQLFLDGEFLTVQTKSGTYGDQVIEAMPHDEDPEMFDVLTVTLKTKEVIIVEANIMSLPAKDVKNPSQARTTNSGEVQGKEGGGGSWAYNATRKGA